MDTLIAVAEEILVGDAATIARLSAEVEMLTRGGIIEVSIRNPSVADYMKHWEGRAEKAEAEITRLTAALSEETEACAKVAETYPLVLAFSHGIPGGIFERTSRATTFTDIAAAIRSRKDKP